eukprot:1160786-Pelagomonas_calceolata.AAC.21
MAVPFSRQTKSMLLGSTFDVSHKVGKPMRIAKTMSADLVKSTLFSTQATIWPHSFFDRRIMLGSTRGCAQSAGDAVAAMGCDVPSYRLAHPSRRVTLAQCPPCRI